MYLPKVRECSTSCFEEGRLSVKERTDLALKPQIIFGSPSISTHGGQGVLS